MSNSKADKAKVLASQIASKGYFAGEAAGLRLASRTGMSSFNDALVIRSYSTEASDKLEQLPPQNAPSGELMALKKKLANSMKEIRDKSSTLTVQDLKRLLFRCAATLISLNKVGLN